MLFRRSLNIIGRFVVSEARKQELSERVQTGVHVVLQFYPSSHWVTELLDPAFTMRYLHYRVISLKEQGFFCSMLRNAPQLVSKAKLLDIGKNHRLNPYVVLGLDIETGQRSQGVQYALLDQLWLQQGIKYRRIFKQCGR